MKALVTSDIHLTDNPRDEYRWEIFPWLAKTAKEHGAEQILILGDITDKKDNHSAKLVNRVVEGLAGLARSYEVIVLKGNHDYKEETTPFLKFLHTLQPKNITFVNEPLFRTVGDCNMAFLPSTESWRTAWKSLKWDEQDFVFAHATFDGSVTSKGYKLEGIPLATVGKGKIRGVCIAGDIHVPQTIGNVTYCGSPYPVCFGDAHDPRVLLVDTETKAVQSIPRITIRKISETLPSWVARSASNYAEGDQVKLRLTVTRDQLAEWPALSARIRESLEARGVIVASLEACLDTSNEVAAVDDTPQASLERAEPPEVVKSYGNAKSVPLPVIDAGEGIVKKLQ